MFDKYFQMVHVIGHLMNLCVLSSNGTMQKKQMLDPSPRLFEVKPNGSPPITTLHMITFGQNGKWEYQPCCHIFHHLASYLHTFHHFASLWDNQDNDDIAWWYNIFLVIPSVYHFGTANPPKVQHLFSMVKILATMVYLVISPE